MSTREMSQSERDALLVDWVRVTVGLEPIAKPGLGRRRRMRAADAVPPFEDDGCRRVKAGARRFPW